MAQVQTIALPLELRAVLTQLASAEVADDQQWILALLRGQGPIVLTVLWRMLGSEQEVLDAYQTAVCQLAIRGKDGIGSNPAGYFYRTAVNAGIETMRFRRKQRAHFPLVARYRDQQAALPSASAVCDQQEMLERMRDAICELPLHLRNVIILRDLAQLSYAEVADMLGIRMGTARLYRHQAVARLADLMGGGGVGMNGHTPSRAEQELGNGRSASPCNRSDLARWSGEGGPLPDRLADHIAKCAGCAEQVRRVSRVHASLALLGNQPLPANLHARANGRALRMLRRVTRASEAAGRLLRMRPDLPFWQRAQVHVARMSMASAAAFLVFMMRLGLLAGIERTETMGQTLASAHWDRHIDPNREWIDRQA